MNDDFLFGLFWGLATATLIFAPALGYFARRHFQRLTLPRRRNVLVVQVGALALAFFIVKTKWSFAGLVADAVVLAAGYCAYCALAFIASTIPPRKLTWLITVVAMGPCLIGFLGAVTGLGLAFIIGDYVPHAEGRISNSDYYYRVSYFGNAITTWGGSELKLLYRYHYFPFIEKQVLDENYDYRDYDDRKLDVRLGTDGFPIATCPRKDGSIESIRLGTSDIKTHKKHLD